MATGALAIRLSAGVSYVGLVNNLTSISGVKAVTEIIGAKDKVEKYQNCGVEFAGILGMELMRSAKN